MPLIVMPQSVEGLLLHQLSAPPCSPNLLAEASGRTRADGCCPVVTQITPHQVIPFARMLGFFHNKYGQAFSQRQC